MKFLGEFDLGESFTFTHRLSTPLNLNINLATKKVSVQVDTNDDALNDTLTCDVSDRETVADSLT